MTDHSTSKTFCPNGSVNTKNHFYVDTSKWNEEILLPSVQNGEFSILIAPSQSGKTTRIVDFVKRLKKDYTVIFLDISSFLKPNMNFNEFNKIMIKEISFEVNNSRDCPPLTDNLKDIFNLNMKIKLHDKDCVLIIDEIDALNLIDKDARISFLSLLRNWKQQQNFYCLVSMIGITNCFGNELTETIGNSSFNVSHFLYSPYFTFEEVVELFKQYQDQENKKIEPEIIKDIYTQTNGAQGLTSLFGKYLSEQFKNPTYSEWNNSVYDSYFFNYIQNNSISFQVMQNKLSHSFCKILIECLKGENIAQQYPTQEISALERINIIKYNKHSYQMEIASEFVKRWIIFYISIQKNNIEKRTLNNLDNLNFFVDLVKSVIENMSIYPFIFGQKVKKNLCIATEPSGYKESIFVLEFYESLKRTFLNDSIQLIHLI
jgi:hypothetical protein